MATREHYSGDASVGFWREVADIEDRAVHDLIYIAGCALQDHEKRVLQMLRRYTVNAEE